MEVQIETYGCAMNQADSEMMAGLLQENGHRVVESADMVIVNTCIVKTPTENKILKKLNELKKSGKKVIITGCMPASTPEVIEKFPGFSFIGTNIFDIKDAVDAATKNRRFVKISDPEEKVCVPRVRKNPIVEIVPISEGCLGNCSYCQVKFARGNLKSYEKEKILRQVRHAVADGVKEVWLTSQDSGAYGLDINENLPFLLNSVSEINGDFKIRVGMMNPNHVLDFLDELVEEYKNEKVYKFLHLPVQSGDNDVLKHMNRKYTVNDFKKIVNKFRRNFTCTLSTDVIVGYPAEDKAAFQNTIKLLKEAKPDVLNISRYWPRPGTSASRLKQYPGRLTKERSRIVSRLFEKIGLENNKKWIGWKGHALVSEKNNGSYTARNFAYKPIILKTKKNLLGKSVDVEITDATHYDLRGCLLC